MRAVSLRTVSTHSAEPFRQDIGIFGVVRVEYEIDAAHREVLEFTGQRTFCLVQSGRCGGFVIGSLWRVHQCHAGNALRAVLEKRHGDHSSEGMPDKEELIG